MVALYAPETSVPIASTNTISLELIASDAILLVSRALDQASHASLATQDI